jgi:threonine dehydratase
MSAQPKPVAEPTIADIRAAAARIEGKVQRTPMRHSTTLSQIAGCEISLKFENLQFTSSFKERGALNKLLSLTDEQRKRGVAAQSAGNHAQAVAYHAQRLGISATIVMPEFTPFIKIKHTKDFGARVVLHAPTPSHRRKGAPSSIPMTIRPSSQVPEPAGWRCWKTCRTSTHSSFPSAAAD